MGWAALIGVDDPGLALSTMAKRDADRLLSTFTSPDGDKRILIVQRPDNAYSYRYQCSDNEMPGDWGPPGPCCGIYDSEAHC
jgi:8-oxo-dGTP pyrophosphatase MutT (NUDIX family)